VSITEKFDKKEVAQKKAKKYLSERLYKTMAANDRSTIKLGGNLSEEKASDQFISSLTRDYEKKQKDKIIVEEKQKEVEISFTKKEVPEALSETIIHVLKKEYAYRIENAEKYDDFNFTISEIASQIQLETKITPGEIYPILENLNAMDIELILLENPDEPEDKKIRFVPIADEALMYTIANFRPDEYNKIRINIIKKFIKFLKRKKVKATLTKLRKEISNNTEEQRAWKEILKILLDYYPLFTEVSEKVREGKDVLIVYNRFPKREIIEEN